MENTYGIGVTNRYALFLDDETDPLETLTLKEQEKELKKKTRIAEKENKIKAEQPAKIKPNVSQKKVIKENAIHKAQEIKRDDSKPSHQRSNADGKPDRNSFSKFNNENNREERNNRRNREERTFNGPSENREREDRPRRENNGENFENRNRGERGGRIVGGNKPSGPRGGPRRPFEDRRGKREFDRQSGSDKTGIKSVDKRDGGGPHNWGSHKDVIEEVDKTNDPEQTWNDAEKTETASSAPEPKGEETNEVEGTAPTEEEPKELTLDEWKAQRAGRAKPQYNIRKAGEGEDPSQWKKMYELRKKEHESESEDEEYDAAEYPQRVGRQKHVLDIDIQFNDNRRGAGGRGGRGQRSGPRGSRPNQRGTGGPGGDIRGNIGGGERPERRYRDDQGGVDERNDNRRAPKVDDERDFPSLG